MPCTIRCNIGGFVLFFAASRSFALKSAAALISNAMGMIRTWFWGDLKASPSLSAERHIGCLRGSPDYNAICVTRKKSPESSLESLALPVSPTTKTSRMKQYVDLEVKPLFVFSSHAESKREERGKKKQQLRMAVGVTRAY